MCSLSFLSTALSHRTGVRVIDVSVCVCERLVGGSCMSSGGGSCVLGGWCMRGLCVWWG